MIFFAIADMFSFGFVICPVLLFIVYLSHIVPKEQWNTENTEILQIIDIIAGHPDHEIIIGIDTLGKEDLLLQIAETLDIKVHSLFCFRNSVSIALCDCYRRTC